MGKEREYEYDMNSVIAGIGGLQALTGAFMKKGQRPRYTPPGAAQEALSTAKMLSNSTVRPGNEYAVGQINRSAGMAANNLNRSLNSGSQILAGVDQIQKNTNQALAGNAAQNTQFRFNAIQNLQGALGNFARYQDRQWQENQLNPYMDRVKTKEMLIGSGLQNLVGGLQAVETSKQQQTYLDYLMGKPNQWAQSGFGRPV